MNVRALWSELKERKVLRLAIIYLVIAWIVIEVADVIFPALLLPEWALRLLVAFLILGFPFALVLSWMFDLTAEGVRRAPKPGTDPVGRAPHGSSPSTSEAAPTAERSVAVLPFVNMSDDRENEYFSDGMTEEILNALAKVRDLRVASRTSAFAFKGQDSDVLEIAR
jgi:adenylate cyclase